MTSLDASPAAAADSRDLRREVVRVRRRARAVLFASAVVAALAAALWYDVIGFWTWRFFRISLYFPLFFFIALAVFAVFVVLRTRTHRLSAVLDGEFGLKGRLSAAFRFERHPGVPADLREAQARETLRAVDFTRLRSSFRFRPWWAFACLAAGTGFSGWLMYRYPESFNPHSVIFRQGRVVFMAVKSIAAGGAWDETGSRDNGNDTQRDGGHPQVALVPETGSPEAPPGAKTSGGTSDEKPPPGGQKGSRDATDPQQKSPAHPETTTARKPPATDRRGDGKGSRLGPDEGGSFGAFGRPVSLEETEGISPPTARPESGLAVGAASLRGPNAGPSLPALPFYRLLGGGTPAETLFDPETLNIVLESYPPKYREHLETYLKALQTLTEDRNGS